MANTNANSSFSSLLENVESLEDHYELGEKIGSGGFTTGVYTAKAKNNNSQNKKNPSLALKILSAKRNLNKHLLREVKNLLSLNHANILSLQRALYVKKTDQIVLVTELCEGGELYEKLFELGKYSEREAAVIIKQIVSALAYCHDVKQGAIAHRDLKPENIMLPSKSNHTFVKIIDWGLSSASARNLLVSVDCGTPSYSAPEIISQTVHSSCFTNTPTFSSSSSSGDDDDVQSIGQKSNTTPKTSIPYTTAVDIWSVGVIAFELIAGELPFGYDGDCIDRAIKGEFDFNLPQFEMVSQDARHFITACLQVDPNKRISAPDALSHPWLQLAIVPTSASNQTDETKVPVINPRHALLSLSTKAKRQQALRRSQSGRTESQPSTPSLAQLSGSVVTKSLTESSYT
mmetsp:Transcript_16863/g.25192  ORF Transcript_16863/g.25192 Transcript_16863/m.25192 type:complete len:403 (+) Transcript_16863:68-1276(+)